MFGTTTLPGWKTGKIWPAHSSKQARKVERWMLQVELKNLTVGVSVARVTKVTIRNFVHSLFSHVMIKEVV